MTLYTIQIHLNEDDSPEGALNEIVKWRKSQGLPLFKDS
ncbi:TPA: bacteriocin immunity protein [Klebsiella pneumoniae]